MYQCVQDWNEKNFTVAVQRYKTPTTQTVLIDSQDESKNLKQFWYYVKGRHQDNVGIGAQVNDMVTDLAEREQLYLLLRM